MVEKGFVAKFVPTCVSLEGKLNVSAGAHYRSKIMLPQTQKYFIKTSKYTMSHKIDPIWHAYFGASAIVMKILVSDFRYKHVIRGECKAKNNKSR